jgi:hypothetical protein
MQFAEAEFLYRYSVLLSDAIEAAHAKADVKKTIEAKKGELKKRYTLGNKGIKKKASIPCTFSYR